MSEVKPEDLQKETLVTEYFNGMASHHVTGATWAARLPCSPWEFQCRDILDYNRKGQVWLFSFMRIPDSPPLCGTYPLLNLLKSFFAASTLSLTTSEGSGTLQHCTPQKAFNLTWKSVNFKTILEWKPKPVNYVYNVEISTGSSNWKIKCFLTPNTECDLTDEIVQDVRQIYQARVLSVPPNNTYLGNPPLTNAPEFLPYRDTKLGQPVIKNFKQVGRKLNVTVEDPRTLVRRNGTFLTLRDVFGKDLSYTLFYRKDTSTGRKTATISSNNFFIDVDQGGSYCFFVQALINSRKFNQKSPESITECTDQWRSIMGETLIIVGAVVFVVTVFIILLSIYLCKRRQGRAGQKRKETSPLRVA